MNYNCKVPASINVNIMLANAETGAMSRIPYSPHMPENRKRKAIGKIIVPCQVIHEQASNRLHSESFVIY